MANNTNCPEVLARLILKNEFDRDNFSCGVGAVGYICPNGTNPDGGMDRAEGEMLAAEAKELKAEWFELTGNEWTWKDMQAALAEWEIRKQFAGSERRRLAREAWKRTQQVGTQVSEEEMESIAESESMVASIEAGERKAAEDYGQIAGWSNSGSRNRFGQMEWL